MSPDNKIELYENEAYGDSGNASINISKFNVTASKREPIKYINNCDIWYVKGWIRYYKSIGVLENVIISDDESMVQIEIREKNGGIGIEIYKNIKPIEIDYKINEKYVDNIGDIELINDKDHHKFIIDRMKNEMGMLIRVCKEDYESEEARREREELIRVLIDNPGLETIEEGIVLGRVDSMICRSWLYMYKGRGYILGDIGNDNWSYICTVEESLVGIHYKQFGVEY